MPVPPMPGLHPMLHRQLQSAVAQTAAHLRRVMLRQADLAQLLSLLPRHAHTLQHRQGLAALEYEWREALCRLQCVVQQQKQLGAASLCALAPAACSAAEAPTGEMPSIDALLALVPHLKPSPLPLPPPLQEQQQCAAAPRTPAPADCTVATAETPAGEMPDTAALLALVPHLS